MSRISVRDLICNACDEARLVNRSQPVPGSIFLSAFTLLQKRLSQYSNTNLLSFTRKEANFDPQKSELLIGTYGLTDLAENNPDFVMVDKIPVSTTGYYGKIVFNKEDKAIWGVSGTSHGPVWGIDAEKNAEDYVNIIPDVEIDSIQEVVRLYFKTKTSNAFQWQELNFVSYEDFYSWENSSYVYSVLPIDDEHIKLLLKPQITDGPFDVKMIYNEPFEFDQDSELNIPRQFVALFTAGLVYDLAMQYPRLSDNTVALLKSRLDELEENVRRSSVVNKLITRDVTLKGITYTDFINGKFLGV